MSILWTSKVKFSSVLCVCVSLCVSVCLFVCLSLLKNNETHLVRHLSDLHDQVTCQSKSLSWECKVSGQWPVELQSFLLTYLFHVSMLEKPKAQEIHGEKRQRRWSSESDWIWGGRLATTTSVWYFCQPPRYYKDSPKSLEVVSNDFQAARSLDENMKPKGTKLNVQNTPTKKNLTLRPDD